jgi:hypothetical protein
MLRTIFGGLDRAGALMLERHSAGGRGTSGLRPARPAPGCEFDYEYYGALAGRVRPGR